MFAQHTRVRLNLLLSVAFVGIFAVLAIYADPPRAITLWDILFWAGMVFLSMRFEGELPDTIISQIDIVAVMSVFILPPWLAMVLVAVFTFTSQMFNNPRFRWTTEYLNHITYGVCTGVVGVLVVIVERETGLTFPSWGAFVLAFVGMIGFYVVNMLLVTFSVVIIKGLKPLPFLRENAAGFPMSNVILSPVAYLGVLVYLNSPFGGWGGWAVLTVLLPVFYTQYIVASQTYAVKQANKKLEANEQTLRSLTQGLPVGVYRVKTDGTLISVNPALAQILGYESPETLMEINSKELFFDPNERDNHRRVWESDAPIFSWDMQLKRKDGRIIWVRDTGRVVYNQAGELDYLDGTIQNITESKVIELELEIINKRIRQAKQEWESTVDALPQFVCLLDTERRVLRSNRVMTMFQMDFKALLDQRIDAVLAEVYGPQPFQALFDEGWAHVQNQVAYSFEIQGKNAIVLVQMRPVRKTTYQDDERSESYAILLLRDITEEKMLEQRLRDMNTQLETRVLERTNELAIVNTLLLDEINKQEHLTQELQQALHQEKELSAFRARFGSLISHEFRTPLTIIQTSADLLQKLGDRITPQMREDLPARIRQQVKHLVNLLEDIMTISQAETVGISRSDKRVNLAGFAHMIERDMAHVIKPTQRLHFSAPQADTVALMDEKMVHQLVTNLVSNASKYSPDDASITLNLQWEGDILLICVKDRGIGIPEAALPRLFDAFYRADNVGVIGGTGLGLAIVKLAVDIHGGEIHVESTPDSGTTFTARLPVKAKDVPLHEA